MKDSQLDKLYSKLTPTELGTLAFEALARKDMGESDLILSNVGWGTYRSVHIDYRNRVMGLSMFAESYGMEHWRNRALMLQAYTELGRDGDKDDTGLGALIIQFFIRLHSIEAALVESCTRVDINIEAVKTFANAWGLRPAPEHANADLVEEYVEMFTRTYSAYCG